MDVKDLTFDKVKANDLEGEREIARRRASALAADASLRLAGLKTPEAAKALRERWILGEINADELIELSKAQLLQDLRKRPLPSDKRLR